MSLDQDVVDYSAALLLRYFKAGAPLGAEAVRLDRARDLAMLRVHWGLSQPVRDLVDYLAAHPHEARSLLVSRERIDDAVARGTVNARRTLIYRLQTGLGSAIVSDEPVRTFDTGPNLLLAWVLREAGVATATMAGWQEPGSPYAEGVEIALRKVRAVQRLEALREPLRAATIGRRPGAGAIRSAARSRQPIYQLAATAFDLLRRLEAGEPTAMIEIARGALLGPLEDWRRFELAVGLAAGEALAAAVKQPLHLRLLAGKSSLPIASAGRFAIYWQQQTELYQSPVLEPSELATRSALSAYGFAVGADRPDLVVVDTEAGQVAAIIEVKYVAGDSPVARFREAVDQVVRYSRGYVPLAASAPLLASSLVAVSRNAPVKIAPAVPSPFSVDFDGLRQHALAGWAAHLSPAAA